jgi:hypothetical protein
MDGAQRGYGHGLSGLVVPLQSKIDSDVSAEAPLQAFMPPDSIELVVAEKASADVDGGAVGGAEIGGIGPRAGSLRLVPERYGIFGKQAITRICTAGCAASARLE